MARFLLVLVWLGSCSRERRYDALLDDDNATVSRSSSSRYVEEESQVRDLLDQHPEEEETAQPSFAKVGTESAAVQTATVNGSSADANEVKGSSISDDTKNSRSVSNEASQDPATPMTSADTTPTPQQDGDEEAAHEKQAPSEETSADAANDNSEDGSPKALVVEEQAPSEETSADAANDNSEDGSPKALEVEEQAPSEETSADAANDNSKDGSPKALEVEEQVPNQSVSDKRPGHRFVKVEGGQDRLIVVVKEGTPTAKMEYDDGTEVRLNQRCRYRIMEYDACRRAASHNEIGNIHFTFCSYFTSPNAECTFPMPDECKKRARVEVDGDEFSAEYVCCSANSDFNCCLPSWRLWAAIACSFLCAFVVISITAYIQQWRFKDVTGAS
eukprot:TRINITY_DN1693_c0_g1_i2.p1 TRINITY_DN1693_c0_g1~~TRINITY_DN1693_c0_g1_i2.p1  ORF type:complete len:388 (-),score=75.06 TRINITY_DN1693_c0_g1_i2:14-1177(-)